VDPDDDTKCISNDAYVVVSLGNVLRGFDIDDLAHGDAMQPIGFSGKFSFV